MERKGFIGGSDCVKIMQGNWLGLWQVMIRVWLVRQQNRESKMEYTLIKRQISEYTDTDRTLCTVYLKCMG
jgi:hypothetical protein